MLLAVFSGIAAFGFWGIVLGPVLMIVIVTTIDVYLAVYKGFRWKVEMPTSPRRPGAPGGSGGARARPASREWRLHTRY